MLLAGTAPPWKRKHSNLDNVTVDEILQKLAKRAPTVQTVGNIWHLSQISLPAGVAWDRDDPPYHLPKSRRIDAYFYDDSAAQGQTIYVVDTDINENHEVSTLSGQKRATLLVREARAKSFGSIAIEGRHRRHRR